MERLSVQVVDKIEVRESKLVLRLVLPLNILKTPLQYTEVFVPMSFFWSATQARAPSKVSAFNCSILAQPA